jgi:hypothetical protein
MKPNPWIKWLKILLVLAPLEFLCALLALLLLPLILLLVLLLLIWQWLLRYFRGRKRGEKKRSLCKKLPEAIFRRPDPCIYSQFYLQGQGLPVTWNNPDIWVAPADNPGAVEPDSYHLKEDTDYLVSVQVHNASTDLALGVLVRLNYRPWSFNSPELVPVETDATGQEAVRFVNILPMSKTVATFKWHTPQVDPASGPNHLCLQASLHHPMDTNTGNNLGQENTNVFSANPGHVVPGQVLQLEIPLHNPRRDPHGFRFGAHVYEIAREKSFELRLKANRGRIRWSPAQRVANFRPTLHPQPLAPAARTGHEHKRSFWADLAGRFEWGSQRPVKAIKTRYVGFDAIRAEILRQEISLPTGMTVTVGGHEMQDELVLEPNETKVVPFTVTVPPDAPPGTNLPLTITAHYQHGGLVGGVTLLLRVKGE